MWPPLGGDEQFFLAMSALVRSVRRGCDFQCVTGKFLPCHVLMRIGSVFFGGFNETIGIDRSVAVMDTSTNAVEFPIF